MSRRTSRGHRDPQVLMSGGPVRVPTEDADPDYVPPPFLGFQVFRYDPPEPEPVPAATEHWARVAASELVLHQHPVTGGWVLVAHEPVAIADQVLEDGWGDQA